VIPYPSIKMGPGDSARSHTANEYILVTEISEGIATYIRLLEGLKF
jgi:acetylornithine deacetylase